MIWHILKKDFRLLWPLLAVVAAIQVGNAALLASGGQFAPSSIASEVTSTDFAWISNSALPFVGLLGLIVVVIAVLQQDRLPGSSQDWLTRPIPRGKMLAAKILLIVLAGLAPILLCDVSLGLIERLHPSDVITASLRRTAALFCFICLPAVIVAIVTRSLTEALIFSLAIVVVVVIEATAAPFSKFSAGLPLVLSGMAWTIALILLLANVLAAAVLLRLQLRWRATNRVRWIALAYLCALPAVVLLPWSVGIGIQKTLTHDSGPLPGALQIDTARRISFSAGMDGPEPASKSDVPYVSIIVPVRLSGASDLRWQLDHADGDLIDPSNGRSLHALVGILLVSRITGDQLTLFLQVPIPQHALQLARQRHGVVRATLFLTSLRPAPAQAVALLEGDGIDEFSRCGWGAEGRAPRCISTRPVATCIGVANRVNPSGPPRRGFFCGSVSYAPWPLPIWRDPYYTHEFSDMAWGESRSARAGAFVWNYAPGAHFARQIEFTLDRVVQDPGLQSLDGTGAAARFTNPGGMVADSHGNLFVVDTTDSTVRKVGLSGEVTTYAGQRGSIGTNDGPRDQARFNGPTGIAVDAADNLYIADSGNGLIRKISPAGVVSTVAGNGSLPGDDTADSRLGGVSAIVYSADGALYMVDRNGNDGPSIRKVLPNGTVLTVAGPETKVSSPKE